jgi:BlaI family penicillinase repressor
MDEYTAECRFSSERRIFSVVNSIAIRYKFHTMPRQKHSGLTMRERQIMDILYRRGRATAAEVMGDLPGEPTDSTVRTQLRILEQKGLIRHVEENLRYVYEPVVARKSIRQSALAHVVDTFFDGSIQKVVAALLGREPVSREELDRVEELVKKARKGGRK